MNWDDLKLILAVERAGSLRRAARTLSLDPSTVSRRIQQLEDSVGARLLDRTSQPPRLTAAGTALTRAASQMEHQLSTAARSIQSTTSEPSGRVRVSFPQILGRPIQKLLGAVPSKYPQLSLELACSDQVVSLAAGEAEIVVRMDETPPPDLVGVRVGALVMGLYSTQEYRERAPRVAGLSEDPSSFQWVDWGPKFRRKATMKWLQESFPTRRVVAEGESGQAVLDAIEADMGVGVQARLHASHLHEWQILPESVCPSIWLLTTLEARSRTNVAVVLEELKRFSHEYHNHLYRGRPVEFENPKGRPLNDRA